MGFTTNSEIAQITLEIREQVKLLEDEIQEELALLGERGVNAAREKGSYTDRTGNLRSSIGYVLAREGQVITASEFAKIVGSESAGAGDVKGDAIGKDIATAAAQRLSRDGFALVLTAGMEYASCVSAKGYDVIDSAELEIRERIDNRFAKLGFGSSDTKWVGAPKDSD